MAEVLLPARVSGDADPAEAPDAETAGLVTRALAGDGDAFGTLVERHVRAAHRVARAALMQPHEADEAVQDACLTAWQRLAELDRPERFRAWFLAITWRKALDRRRVVTAWWRRLALPVREEAPDPLMDVAAPGRSPLDETTDRDRDRAVGAVIRSLPPRLRDALLLAAAGGHRYDEIGAILGMPVGTVKWRVSRARAMVKDKLARLGHGN